MMHHKLIPFHLLLASFLTLAFSDDSSNFEDWKVNEKESNFSLEGSSNLHDWSCNVPEFDGSVSMDPEAMAKWPDENPLFVRGATISIPVKAIACGKDGMNQKLQEAMKAEEHPQIRYQFQKMKLIQNPSSLEKVPFIATGELTIAGKTRSVQVPVVGRRLQEDRFSFSGSHRIDMTEYDVEPPKAMLGSLKTDEEVKVSYTVVVEN